MSTTTQATLPSPDRGVGVERVDTRIVLTWGVSDWSMRMSITSYYDRHIIDETSEAAWDYATGCADRILAEPSQSDWAARHDDLDRIAWCHGSDRAEVIADAVEIAELDACNPRHIVIIGAKTLGESLSEIAVSVDKLRSAGAKLSVFSGSERIDLTDSTSLLRAADRAGIELQRETHKRDIRLWSGVDKEGGRAGLGFDWVEIDGGTEWVPAEDYDEVCSVLEMVRDGEMSKNKAAAHLDTSPRTITRCLEERPARYGL